MVNIERTVRKDDYNKERVSAIFSHQLDEESPLRSSEEQSGALVRQEWRGAERQ